MNTKAVWDQREARRAREGLPALKQRRHTCSPMAERFIVGTRLPSGRLRWVLRCTGGARAFMFCPWCGKEPGDGDRDAQSGS